MVGRCGPGSSGQGQPPKVQARPEGSGMCRSLPELLAFKARSQSLHLVKRLGDRSRLAAPPFFFDR